MSPVKHCLKQYVERNIHVSVSVLSLALLTYLYSGTSIDWFFLAFSGFGTLVAYTYIKNVPPKGSINLSVKQVILRSPLWINILALLLVGLILFLNQRQQIVLGVLMLLCLVYILPTAVKDKDETSKNICHSIPWPLRDFGAVKIVIVAFVWSGISVVMPLISEGWPMRELSLLFIAQSLWIIVLTIPFEIRDSGKDQLRHPTWPQKLGLSGVKVLGICLLLISVAIHIIINRDFVMTQGTTPGFMDTPYVITMILTVIGLIKAKPKQSFWYSAFWIEGIPIAWLILNIGFNFYLK
jgi:hypothetical protein